MIEQDGVLILETVETDPNDPEALPQVCIHHLFHIYNELTSCRVQQSSLVLVMSPWTCPQTWTTLQSWRSWRGRRTSSLGREELALRGRRRMRES